MKNKKILTLQSLSKEVQQFKLSRNATASASILEDALVLSTEVEPVILNDQKNSIPFYIHINSNTCIPKHAQNFQSSLTYHRQKPETTQMSINNRYIYQMGTRDIIQH